MANVQAEMDGDIRSAADHRPSWKWRRFRGGAFEPYGAARSMLQGVTTRKPLVLRLTKEVVHTYQTCNPDFKCSDALNPKRVLTNPSVGILNDGHDNANSDLVLYVNLVLTGSKQRYIVKDMLGQGSFGQVAKCWATEMNKYVAVKVIKNHSSYYQQALVEVSLLTMLNRKYDPLDKNHIVRIHDYFVYRHHLCISFELLGSNLYELIRLNHFKGLSLNVVRVISRQILEALVVMKDADIIHCDLKPENILLSTSAKPAEIKVIDFGSACLEGQTVYSYVQSRYYRSPEVLLGYPYTAAVDMWSFGCIVAELFLGLPLFPGASEFDLLKRMMEILGEQPHDELLRDAKNTTKYFKQVGSIYRRDDDGACRIGQSSYQVLREEEYEAREGKKAETGKQYFNYSRLEDIIRKYPSRRNMLDQEFFNENVTRLALVDFLRGLLEFDPGKRWSPLQASGHPFVTGEPFTCPYRPASEMPRFKHVLHDGITVDHHPGGGHWLATGLSPQVSHLNKGPSHNSGDLHKASMSNATSFVSVGSHGSFSDNVGFGSSYGSYGDVSNLHTVHSPVRLSNVRMHLPFRGSIVGPSSDVRRRVHMSQANGFSLSPCTGEIGPMSLGTSPSQFPPANSHMHISTASPGKYGPRSPSRGSLHGSPLGKAAAFSQYNRRRNSGYAGSSCMHPFDNASQQWQMSPSTSGTCGYSDTFVRGHLSSPNSLFSSSIFSYWRPQSSSENGSSFEPGICYQNFDATSSVHENRVTSQPHEAWNVKPECTLPPHDPADWDPNYSDEQFLQEESSDVNSLSFGINSNLHLSHTSKTSQSTVGSQKFIHGCHQGNTSTNFWPSNGRSDSNFHGYAIADGSHLSGHDLKPDDGFFPHFLHNLPSRFGQQPLQKFDNMHSISMHSGPNYPKGQQLPCSTYSMAELYSPANGCFGDGLTWERMSGQPITTTSQPSSHARTDYWRIL